LASRSLSHPPASQNSRTVNFERCQRWTTCRRRRKCCRRACTTACSAWPTSNTTCRSNIAIGSPIAGGRRRKPIARDASLMPALPHLKNARERTSGLRLALARPLQTLKTPVSLPLHLHPTSIDFFSFFFLDTKIRAPYCTPNPSSILDLLKTVGFFRKSLFCNARFPKTLVV